MRDFYKVLGIASAADDTQVKSAFRRLAKALHPDLNPGDQQAEQRFKALNQAYEVLRDARARVAYDVFLAERRSEVRRRFAHSATVMVATFVLTMGCAYVVMALQGAGLPLWEGRQLAKAPAHVTETKSAPAGRVDSGSDVIAGVAATTLSSAMPLPPPLAPAPPRTGILQHRATDDGSHPDVVASAAMSAAVPGHGPPAANVQSTAQTRALSAGDAANLPSPEQGADAREADSKLQARNPGPQVHTVSVRLAPNAPADRAETADLGALPTTAETSGALGVVNAVSRLQRRKLASGRLDPETLPPAKAPKKLAAIETQKAPGGEFRKTALQASGPASQGGQPWPTADEPFVGAGTTSRY